MRVKEIYVKVIEDGPYLIYGFPKIAEQTILADSDGISVEYCNGEVYKIAENPVSLCRCGKSANAPFCDGTHKKKYFDGKETASFDLIINGADAIKGPNYTLLDNEKYCAFARFCDAEGRIWNLVTRGDKYSDEMAVKEACHCPAGRLIIIDNDGNKPIELDFEPSISPLEDSGLKISGPLWVKGRIRVESASGKSYEVRNRQTLCRCGYSENKPFCNGAHASVKYKAKKKPNSTVKNN